MLIQARLAGLVARIVLADAGEDEVSYTEDGQYAANVEKAVCYQKQEPSPFTTMKTGNSWM